MTLWRGKCSCALRDRATAISSRDSTSLPCIERFNSIPVAPFLHQQKLASPLGSDDLKKDHCQASPVGSLEGQLKERAMAVNKPSGQEIGSRAEVDQRNMIGVAFGDLPEDDQR
jgi:hypothetical protein